jgi:hypothetical protein
MEALYPDLIFHGLSQQQQKSSGIVIKIGHMRHFKH